MLRGVDGISFIHFDDVDVVRHNLVQRIVRAYERWNNLVGATRQLTLKLDTMPNRKRPSSRAPNVSCQMPAL